MVKRIPMKAAKAAAKKDPAVTKSVAGKGDEQIEGTSGLAKRVGKVKKGSDIGEFMARVSERNSVVRIIDALEAKRAMAPHVWAAIENGLIRIPGESAEDNKVFFTKKVPRVSALPTEWVASWIAAKCKDHISREKLDLVDGHDPEAIHQVFCAIVRVSMSTPLAQELQHKATCARVFATRLQTVGEKRMKTLTANIRPDGSIDWARWGPYKLKWAAKSDKLESIEHVDGDGTSINPLPAHVVVTTDFKLNLPWPDFEASLSMGSSSHKLHRVFKDKEGPNLETPGKKLELLSAATKTVLTAMEAEAKKEKESVVDEDEGSFLKKHNEKVTAHRQAVLEAARQKLQSSAEKRRQVDLSK